MKKRNIGLPKVTPVSKRSQGTSEFILKGNKSPCDGWDFFFFFFFKTPFFVFKKETDLSWRRVSQDLGGESSKKVSGRQEGGKKERVG